MNANVKTINLAVIQALADTKQDDLSQYDQLTASGSDELANAVADLVKQERSDATKAAAKEIQNLLSMSAAMMSDHVQQVRKARAEAKVGLNKLKVIERARAYGLETMDFMPLATATTGFGASYVPDSWVSKVELAESPKPEASAKPRVTVAKRK
jgi:hypothetical protein